jgi:hypothetical protein
MIEQHEQPIIPLDEVARNESPVVEANPTESFAEQNNLPVPETAPSPPVEAEVPDPESNGVADGGRHARAGREGARRVHQLIREGRLYEQEHGLKRGRQRLRQLIELGKLYEQEHGLRPARPKKRGQRLSHLGRQELLATLLDCLLRIAKPSFRQELVRLVERLQQEPDGHAA